MNQGLSQGQASTTASNSNQATTALLGQYPPRSQKHWEVVLARYAEEQTCERATIKDGQLGKHGDWLARIVEEVSVPRAPSVTTDLSMNTAIH